LEWQRANETTRNSERHDTNSEPGSHESVLKAKESLTAKICSFCETGGGLHQEGCQIVAAENETPF
jgi:hypothetical protein